MSNPLENKIIEAAKAYASDNGCDKVDHDLYEAFIAGADLSITLVTETVRNWSRETESSGV
jgi:hypothetical protein